MSQCKPYMADCNLGMLDSRAASHCILCTSSNLIMLIVRPPKRQVMQDKHADASPTSASPLSRCPTMVAYMSIEKEESRKNRKQ